MIESNLVNRPVISHSSLNAYRSGETELANETTSQILAALSQVSSRRLLGRLQPLAAEAAATRDSTATDLTHQLEAAMR